MRPRSRFITPALFTALISLSIALSISATASAGSVDSSVGSEPAALEDTTLVDLDLTFAAATARMDERLGLAFSNSTTMDCKHDVEMGLETCVVYSEAMPSDETAPLAAN